MKMVICLLILVLSWCLCSPLWAAEIRHGFEGERMDLPNKGATWIENGQILRAEAGGKGLILHLLHAGQSELRTGQSEYNIIVLNRRQHRTLDLLSKVISRTLSLHVEIENDHIVVKGPLTRWQDWETLAGACADFDCEYEMRPDLSKNMESTLRDTLAEKLKANSIYQYRLETNDHFQLHLSPKNPQREKILKFLNRYGIRPILDLTSIDMVPSVKVQVTIAEIKRSEFLKYGIEWPPLYTARVLGPDAGQASPLDISVQGLEQNGMGRVLASPNLLCKSGKEAEFWAGGEFPIKVVTQKIHEVVWKKYGILMKLKPIADFSGRMSISIETEISSIDPDRTVDGVPALYTNRLESHFDLSSPKTIALSGLIKHEQGESQSGLPGLSRIPILGALFSSSDFRENRTELVIFVKPEIISEREQ